MDTIVALVALPKEEAAPAVEEAAAVPRRARGHQEGQGGAAGREVLRVILGLGNVGSRYQGTRHNVGFRVVERLAERARARWQELPGPERLAFAAEAELAGQAVALVKPRTLMNRSGRAAAAAIDRYRCPVEELLVVFDDADLLLGRVRVRQGGGAGGHNGLRSLMDVLRSSDFGRVKLGVKGEGREESDLADYVLHPFAPRRSRSSPP
jgi:PTH1 family peptidyl-tRNA hydrolase